VLRKALLLSANLPHNGILLCHECHTLHDSFRWHFLPSQGIVVEEALLQDATLGAQWRSREGLQLTKPDAGQEMAQLYWPPERVWEVAFEGFTSAQAKRSAHSAVNPMSCDKCDWRGKNERGYAAHTCRSLKGTLLFTPIGRGRRTGVGAAGGAL
jgi:hypothetical protein